MENVDIIGKLNDLASRIDAKEGINNKYKELVKSRLTSIAEKIKNLLVRQKEMIATIKGESKTKLSNLGKKLNDMKNDVKRQGEQALSDSTKNNKELQDKLDASENDIAKLKEQLATPDPDLANLRDLVKKLEEQIAEANRKQDTFQEDINNMRAQLAQKDATIEEMTTSMTEAINLIVDLITKVDKMSMTDADVEEITKQLDDIDKTLDNPDSGNDGDGDLGIADMFNETVEAATDAVENATEAATDAVENATEAATAGLTDEEQKAQKAAVDFLEEEEKDGEEELSSDEKAVAEAEKQPWWNELTDQEKVLYGKPQGRSQRRGLESDAKSRLKKKGEPTAELSEDLQSMSDGDFKEVEEEGTMVLNEPNDDESAPVQSKKKTRKERQELSDMMNLQKNRGDLQKMVDEANQPDNLPKGGKYRKSRRHRKKGKTIKKKGGYVIKKSSSHKTSKKHMKKKSRSSGKTKSSKSSA